MTELASHLLANRELLSLQTARIYLGSRARVCTPLGAAEFLMVRCPTPRGYAPADEDPAEMKRAYDYRVRVALECDEIYRACFAREYASSPAPYLSTKREHELYQLVHRHLFPLVHVDEDDREPVPPIHFRQFLEATPDFFLPYMPLRGAQKHLWELELVDFAEINLAYQIALVLSREFDLSDWSAWKELNKRHKLKLAEPALPLASVGWTEFLHTCAVEETPLRFLPLAFQAISYKTGNPFLDLPPIGALGFEWEMRKVLELTILWNNAIEILGAIDTFAAWLEEDAPARVARAYEIWNRAAAIEAESPFAGMLPSDLIAAGGQPVTDDMELVMLTREMRERMQ